jgi:tripartite-type tricarboxylate transporter receptor subunit TctC
MGFVSAGTAAPQWKAGKIKLVAIGAKKRLPQLPDIPTVAETVPGYEGVSWFGLFGPAGMPASTVAKINAEVRALFADAEFRKIFLDRYMFQSIAGTPQELTNFVKSEEPKWRKIISDAKIKVE